MEEQDNIIELIDDEDGRRFASSIWRRLSTRANCTLRSPRRMRRRTGSARCSSCRSRRKKTARKAIFRWKMRLFSRRCSTNFLQLVNEGSGDDE